MTSLANVVHEIAWNIHEVSSSAGKEREKERAGANYTGQKYGLSTSIAQSSEAIYRGGSFFCYEEAVYSPGCLMSIMGRISYSKKRGWICINFYIEVDQKSIARTYEYRNVIDYASLMLIIIQWCRLDIPRKYKSESTHLYI